MDIQSLGADDLDLIEQTAALQTTVNAANAPWCHPTTAFDFRNQVIRGWDGQPDSHFVGVEDGVVVAHGSFYVPVYDNPQLSWLDVTVHPDRRRRGLGGQMLKHLIEESRALGRSKLFIDAWDGSPGPAFAERHGFAQGSRSINRRQHLPELSSDILAKLYDEAATAAPDYELLRIVGATPEELLPAVAEMSVAINDAPMDDLEIDDEVYSPERITDYEQAQLANGMRLYRLLARHRDSGELGGHSVVAVENERPTIGHQHDTSVVRAHRGHRLGLLLKTGMNSWLAEVEPQLETIDTWNAESNDHMIAVNEQLAYRWMGRGLQFQLRLD